MSEKVYLNVVRVALALFHQNNQPPLGFFPGAR
jgi:hypothetical protein